MTEVVHSVFTGTSVSTFGALPRLTLDAWLRLPEVEAATCPECGGVGYAINAVWTCPSWHQWRWPGVMGLD